MRGLRKLLAGMVVAAAALPGTASAAPPDVRAQIVGAVAAQIPGAEVRGSSSSQEPFVGVPAIHDLAAGRAEVMLDPAFWTQIVGNLLVDRTVVLPKPVDLVKPEMYLPTAPIANGRHVWPLRRHEIDLSGLRYEWQGRQKSLRDYMHSTETDIIAFLRDGEIITDLYANGWSSEVRHQPWSVTKSFVSAVVGIALDEGRVRSIEDPIDRYIAELRGTAWEGTTIRNLLEMESGVHWDEDTPVLAVNTQVQQWVQAALDLYTNGALGQGRNEFLKSLPRVAPQGTKFSYNSGNTQVLAWLIETVYGKPFNEVISEKLWQPTGMAGDARILTDRAGDAIASQGLYARVFDLARFGELFRNGGRTPDGRQVVPRNWVGQSTAMTELSQQRYGFQWWAGPTPGSYQASGFQGQKISVSPAHCMTGVRLSHTLGADLSDGFDVEMGAEEWITVYRAVADRLGACPQPAAPADARAPGLRVAGGSRLSRRAALRRRALRLVLRANERTRATVRVTGVGRHRRTTLARRTLTLPARTTRVSVRLTRAGRRLLRARGSTRVLVTVTGGGERARRTRVVR
ncbi:MAG: serine hydrolase domain-containing protein [Thermoleophilaceae bacterium]